MTDELKHGRPHNTESHFEIPQLRHGLDKAAVYLHTHAQTSDDESINPRKLLWKIDWKIVPIACACYTMQFIDKANINVGFLLINSFKAEYGVLVCSRYGAL